MDHRYIDEHSVAARYIDNALTAEERLKFEAHMVDCQDCTDRILLAGIFHARKNGAPVEPGNWRAKVIARMAPWRIVVSFVLAGVLAVAIPVLLLWIFWK